MQKDGCVVELATKREERQEALVERLFKEHESALQAFFRVRVRSAEDRQDILQDVFYRLLRVEDLAEKLRSRNPLAYLFTISNNLITDHFRKKSVRQTYGSSQNEETPEMPVHITPETIHESRQDLDRVKAIILTLEPRCRRAFILNRIKFMSYREVAEEMDVPVKRVEKYISKALLALRNGMDRQ